jgi:hypothetical protein
MSIDSEAKPRWTIALPLQKAPLTDEEWTGIAGSLLPATARPVVARAIMFYRIGLETSEAIGSPQKAKTALEKAAHAATELKVELERAALNPLATLGFAIASQGKELSSLSIKTARGELQDLISLLGDLQSRLTTAAESVAPGRSGAHQRSVLISLVVMALCEFLNISPASP